MLKRLTISFAFFIFLVIVLADMGRLGFLGVINRIPYGDKIGHFLLYGILTLLLNLTLLRSLPHRSLGLVVISTGLFLAFAIGVEEYSQQFFRSRTFSLLDLAFGYLGVIFFSRVALCIRQQGRGNPPLQDYFGVNTKCPSASASMDWRVHSMG